MSICPGHPNWDKGTRASYRTMDGKHVPVTQLVCALCNDKLIKCDYCDTVEVIDGRLPEGWFSGRFYLKPPEPGMMNTLVKGPTACPFHHEKLMMLLGLSKAQIEEVLRRASQNQQFLKSDLMNDPLVDAVLRGEKHGD